MIHTTLKRIRVHNPCANGWQKLLKHLGKTEADDEPLSYATILESNGLDDALWAFRAEPQHKRLWRHMACDFAETVRHLMPHPDCMKAVQTARLYADGYCDDAARLAAAAAARKAAAAAWSAEKAGWLAAESAADAAARSAAESAAWSAARLAADAAAWWRAWSASRSAASVIFLHRVSGHEPVVAWGTGARVGWQE